MPKCVEKFVEFAFENFGIVRVDACPFSHNVGSRRVLEKCGFELEGVLKSYWLKDGRTIDGALFSKVKGLHKG